MSKINIPGNGNSDCWKFYFVAASLALQLILIGPSHAQNSYSSNSNEAPPAVTANSSASANALIDVHNQSARIATMVTQLRESAARPSDPSYAGRFGQIMAALNSLKADVEIIHAASIDAQEQFANESSYSNQQTVNQSSSDYYAACSALFISENTINLIR